MSDILNTEKTQVLTNLKKENKKHALFQIRPVKNSSSATIRCIGHITEEERVIDEPIVCTSPDENKNNKKNENEKYIHDISESLYVRFYRPSVTDVYLMTTKILPVMYCSIMYQDTLVGGLLFNIFVEFKIVSEITNEKDLIGKNLDGKYQITIRKNDTTPPKYTELDTYFSDKMTIEILKSIIDTKEINDMIAEILEERRLERVEKYGKINTDIPTVKYNFNKLVKEYMETNKLSL